MIVRHALARSAVLASALALVGACASARASKHPAHPAEADAIAPGWTRRAFAVPEHGSLLLSIPPGWTATEGEEGEASAPAIRLEDPGHRFAVLLTPLWNPGEPEAAEARADTAQLFAEIARRKALGGSVEREIPLEELSGPEVKGFWFSATDRELLEREPGPGEWRNILQGAAAVGPVILAFTLLDNGPGPQRSQLLELVRTAGHVEDGERGGVDELEPRTGRAHRPAPRRMAREELGGARGPSRAQGRSARGPLDRHQAESTFRSVSASSRTSKGFESSALAPSARARSSSRRSL